mmetsp:Transcript_13313/g.21656  ORF Transcript_13313/g.21656 Transcript_13313/m.21656 type:complete len:189 (+) Transcript_13313:578-1144(+)
MKQATKDSHTIDNGGAKKRKPSCDATVQKNDEDNDDEENEKRSKAKKVVDDGKFKRCFNKSLSNLPIAPSGTPIVGEEKINAIRRMIDANEILDMEGFPLKGSIKGRLRHVLDESLVKNDIEFWSMTVTALQKVPRYCRVCKRAGQSMLIEEHDCPYCKHCFIYGNQCVLRQDCSIHRSLLDNPDVED